MKRISRHALAVVTLLAWTLGAGLFLARYDSMTTDEGVHVASGYLALTRHDFRFDSEHPFVFKDLTALPLLALRLNQPKDDQNYWDAARSSWYDSWRESRGWSDEWFYTSGNNADLMIFLARIPAVLMLVLTVWLVYWISRQWFGKKVALWAMLFTAFNPLLLGNGHLANTDIPLVTTFLLAAYALWRYGEHPDLKRASWFGGACLAAMMVKFSGIVLIPVFLVYVIVLALKRRVGKNAWGHVGATALLVYGGIWIAYFFHSHYVPGAPYLPTSLNRLVPFLESHGTNLDRFSQAASHFLPMEYLKCFFFQADNIEVGRPAYLLNQVLPGGIWYYFPALYLLKTPLIQLALLFMGGWLAFRRRLTHSANLVLGLILLIFGVVAITNKLNIGLRHILPLFPILSIYMALAADRIKHRFAGPAIALLTVLPVLAWFPQSFNYGNILVWPPGDAWRYYNDSNLDWGKDTKQIAQVVHDLYPGQLVFFNTHWSPYALEYYGVASQSFNPKNPPHDGIAIVSASQMSDPNYARFAESAPATSISNTTFIFVLR